MSTFLNANQQLLIDAIHSAKSRVVYVSPGLDDTIASALINASKNIGKDNVSVLLDVSENVLRIGYGNIEGITLLREEGIAIREESGLRIGALVYDDTGLIFTPTPLLVESGKKDSAKPNAVNASPEQVQAIVQAVCPAPSDNDDTPTDPEIGISEVRDEKIAEVDKKITENPPQKFDLERKVRVFSTAIEFVEIKLKGCQINAHVVNIPPDLLVHDIDDQTRDQLRANFNIIERDSELSGDSDKLDRRAKALRDDFTRSIKKHGRALLKANKSDFENAVKKLQDDIKEFQNKVNENLEAEIKGAKSRMLNLLIPRVKENPPVELRRQIISKEPSEEQIKKYLNEKFDRIFPSATDVTKAMSLEVIFKGVTYETVTDEEFQQTIEREFGLINWDKMFKEYDAVRESEE